MALPSLVCLKSVYNDKYLRYRHEYVQTHGLLQFAGEDVMDPYAQFEVQNANWGGLVHLKSRYNNKYLVRWSPNHHWITASAYAPDENQNNWTCTLFRPVIVEEQGDTKQIRLLHVQLGHYASLWRVGAPFDDCLFAGSSDPDQDSTDVFTVVDWESLFFKFPKRVAFKGDNGLYLGATYNGQHAFQFSYHDVSDPRVGHEIFPSPDGTIFIRSGYYGKFWRAGDGNQIVADAEDPRGTNNASAMFRASVVDTNVVALMNMDPTWFCGRLTTGFLCAEAQIIDQAVKLQVVDL